MKRKGATKTMTLKLLEPIESSGWGPADDHLSSGARIFRGLADQWLEETAGFPLLRDRFANAAYLQIIDWGDDAIPHLLTELKHGEPDHWFEALQRITAANPVSDSDRGNVKAMAEAWLGWGRLKGWTK